jgi:phosphate butyryltransferase
MKSINELIPLSRNCPKQRIAVVYAHDEFVMDAIALATQEGIISPILIGDEKIIHELLHQFKITEPCEVINCLDGELASRIAVDLVNAGKADILMKGLLDTKVLLKAVVNSTTGIKEDKLLSHVGIVSLPTMDRVLFATDGAMNIYPTVEEKILIIENAVKLTKLIGYELPKVGLVSAVEKVNPKILSTVEADQIVHFFRESGRTDFLIDGPFAVDNLVSEASVIHKGIHSPVAGKADILVFPNLDGGNIFYKTCVFLGNAEAAGIVIGAKVPIVLTSRADSSDTKANSIALGVIYGYGLSHSRR